MALELVPDQRTEAGIIEQKTTHIGFIFIGDMQVKLIVSSRIIIDAL
jgi:hypothetical protein